MDKQFPRLWQTFDICLSVISTLKLQDLKDPTGVNLIGDPSSEKGTVLSCFYECPRIYRSDTFTPKSFVTGLNIKSEKRLKQIDLLPRIENKCILIPELAPIFNMRKEDLIQNLAILTRVFDGQGLTIDVGTVGRRGYRRPITFAWLGATTPLPFHTWSDMIRLGTRMFFHEIPQPVGENVETLINDVFKTEDYSNKIALVNVAIKEFLGKMFETDDTKSCVKNFVWEKEKDEDEAYFFITQLAQLVTKLRSPLRTWRSYSDDKLDYEYKIPMKERPKRAMMILYNIARGHAINYGRDHIIKEDVKNLIPITFSSMPDDRRRLWNLLIKNPNGLTYEIVKEEYKCSKQHAHRIMKNMKIIGVGEFAELSDDRYKVLELKSEFADLIDVLKKIGDDKNGSAKNNDRKNR